MTTDIAFKTWEGLRHIRKGQLQGVRGGLLPNVKTKMTKNNDNTRYERSNGAYIIVENEIPKNTIID